MMGIVGMLFSVAVLVLVFGFVLIVRYMQYRETVRLAEHGLVAPRTDSGNGRGLMRWGVVFTFLGVAASCGLYPLGWWFARGGDFPLRFGPWMLLGLLPLACGLALLTIYALSKTDPGEDAQPAQAVGTGPAPQRPSDQADRTSETG